MSSAASRDSEPKALAHTALDRSAAEPQASEVRVARSVAAMHTAAVSVEATMVASVVVTTPADSPAGLSAAAMVGSPVAAVLAVADFGTLTDCLHVIRAEKLCSLSFTLKGGLLFYLVGYICPMSVASTKDHAIILHNCAVIYR